MTTINVDAETHENIITLQSVLTLMSGEKPSISETVKYAASNILSGATFTVGGGYPAQSCRGNEMTSFVTSHAVGCNTMNASPGYTCSATSDCNSPYVSNGIFFTRSLH